MRQPTYPRELNYRSGPWTEMRTFNSNASDVPKIAALIQNGYLKDVDTNPVVVGRPGFALVGAGGGVGTQLGSVGNRNSQLIYQFTRQDGTEFSIAIVGGKFYTYAFGTDQFTEVVTAANFTTAGITLSTSARCHAVTFANKVIITDGINTPWMWDGTAGAGGLTKLTNCPVLYGQPWVYYGRLFGIKGATTASRISIVWSEVGDATLGYDTAPYTNVWDVAQTAQAIFYAGAATNDSMVLMRAQSSTRLVGPVGTDFSSTVNREGVHEFVGTISPSGTLVYQDAVYFFTSDGRIMRVPRGGAAQEVAIGAREYASTLSRSKFTVVDAVVWNAGSSGEFLLWALSSNAGNNPDTILVVDPRQGTLSGIWSGWAQTRMGVWKDSNGVPRLVHGGGTNAQNDADGYTYVHGTPTGAVWNDGFNAGTASIAHSVTAHTMAFDETSDKYWDIVNVSFLVPADLTGIGVQVRTPYTVSAPITAGATLSGGGAKWGQFNWGSGLWGGGNTERQLSAGAGLAGRWCEVTVNHQAAGEQFQLQSIAARAYQDTRSGQIA